MRYLAAEPHQEGNDSGEFAGIEDAIRLAEQLSDQLREIRDREHVGQERDLELVERLRALEEDHSRSLAAREQLRALVRAPATAEQLAGLQAILDAWVRRPNDLLVMVKLSEQASLLLDVVAAFRLLRTQVDIDLPSRGEPDASR